MDLNQFKFPEEFIKRLDGDGLTLVKDLKERNMRVCIFSSSSNMRMLANSKYVVGDGTFKTSPDLFKQLYSLHGTVGGPENRRSLPLVYALMTNKSQDCYNMCFDGVVEYADELNLVLAPQFFISDFEKAVLNVVKQFFPSISNKTCLFHLGQIIWRKVQSLGLAKLYTTDTGFRLFVRKILALAFLTPDEILQYFPRLADTAPADAKKLLEFFDKNYVRVEVRKVLKNGTIIRTPPRFSPILWSCHENNNLKIPRTSNSVEAWHRRWENLIAVAHPGIFRFVEEIGKEIHNTEGACVDILAGRPRPPMKREVKDKELRLANIVNNRNSYSLDMFIDSLAHNMKI